MSEDNTAVEIRQSQELSPAEVFVTIAQLAKDPNTNVEKFERLIALQERMVARQAEASFNAAMARLQPKLPVITKHGRIEIGNAVQSTFAKYEDIDAAIRPLLNEEGFSFSFTTSRPVAGVTRIVCVLSHRDGHSRESEISLPEDTKGNKNGTQGVGSTVSYGKRYLVSGMLNIITREEDDDATKGAYQPIDEEKIRVLEDYLMDVGADRAKFLQFMDVQKLSEIQNRDFAKGLNALKAKQRRGK